MREEAITDNIATAAYIHKLVNKETAVLLAVQSLRLCKARSLSRSHADLEIYF